VKCAPSPAGLSTRMSPRIARARSRLIANPLLPALRTNVVNVLVAGVDSHCPYDGTSLLEWCDEIR
jgi:hypothetical protein